MEKINKYLPLIMIFVLLIYLVISINIENKKAKLLQNMLILDNMKVADILEKSKKKPCNCKEEKPSEKPHEQQSQ